MSVSKHQLSTESNNNLAVQDHLKEPSTASAANKNLAAAAASGSQEYPNLGLTPDEEEKCSQAFTAFDKDGSEDIDIDELRIVLKMMGIAVTESKLQRMMTEANPINPTSISKA